MTIASMGLHGSPRPREPRRFPNRKRPTLSEQTLTRIAENARLLDERVHLLRAHLVAQAEMARVPKVLPYLEAQGWPNEAGITKRFTALYGSPPKTYALAFAPCPSCGLYELQPGCRGCEERQAVRTKAEELRAASSRFALEAEEAGACSPRQGDDR